MDDAVVGSTSFKPQPGDITPEDRQLSSILHDRGYAHTDGRPLFHAVTENLWDVFLEHLPTEEIRQTYRCTACRHFMERYGDLVHVPQGTTQIRSIFWDPYGGPFDAALAAVRHKIEKSVIGAVFCPKEKQYGIAQTGPWEHFHVVPARTWRPRNPLLKPHEEAAERAEDVKMLRTAVLEFSTEMARNALHLLTTSDRFQRNEKVLGPAQWFFDVRTAYDAAVRHKDKEVVLWTSVATAPPGFPHVRSTMIGTLLEDLAKGLPLSVVTEKFNAKVGGLVYQRPQAAPAAGQIARAEKVIAELGYTKSLERRFLRLEETVRLWSPPSAPAPPVAAPGQGRVFEHLKPKTAPAHQPVEGGLTNVTWSKFQRDILPTARMIELHVPTGRHNWMALTTASDPEAPPIMQWDAPELRNPVAWYVYHNGSEARRWGLTPGTYAQVAAVCRLPSRWTLGDNAPDNWGDGACFLIDGMRDLDYKNGALFFPETLRAELREIRSTLEAYAKNGSLTGADQPMAAGADFRKRPGKSDTQWRLRVTSPLGRAEYLLDRWE